MFRAFVSTVLQVSVRSTVGWVRLRQYVGDNGRPKLDVSEQVLPSRDLTRATRRVTRWHPAICSTATAVIRSLCAKPDISSRIAPKLFRPEGVGSPTLRLLG